MKFCEEISQCLVTESGVHFSVHVTVYVIGPFSHVVLLAGPAV